MSKTSQFMFFAVINYQKYLTINIIYEKRHLNKNHAILIRIINLFLWENINLFSEILIGIYLRKFSIVFFNSDSIGLHVR